MRTYLYCEAGFVEKAQWLPNSWVNVVCPNNDDFEFLTKTLNVPESFLDDIADTDERPRTDTEGNWLLTILRIPVQNKQNENLPFGTVPIGIITNNEIIVSVCYYNTDLLPDFIEHTRRKGIIVRNKLDLILRLIYSSAVWFLKYLKQINLDISAAEKELERSIRNEDLLRLMRLQKTLVYFNTSIRGNEVMIGKLKTIFQDTDYLDKELVEDVIIELKQALNTVHHPRDAHDHLQLLWHECGYPLGRSAFCFLADCALLHRIVNIGVRDIPENQMVLNSTQNLLYGILLHIIEVVQTCKIKTACHLI